VSPCPRVSSSCFKRRGRHPLRLAFDAHLEYTVSVRTASNGVGAAVADRLTSERRMAEFQTVANVGEIPEGEGRAFPVNGTMVAVYNLGGEYRASSDTCPHMGASLSAGYLEGDSITCPWHAWRFCVREGTWLDAPQAKLRLSTYEVRVQGNEIQVLVPDPEPRTFGAD